MDVERERRKTRMPPIFLTTAIRRVEFGVLLLGIQVRCQAGSEEKESGVERGIWELSTYRQYLKP